jgi:hypothetical protein
MNLFSNFSPINNFQSSNIIVPKIGNLFHKPPEEDYKMISESNSFRLKALITQVSKTDSR